MKDKLCSEETRNYIGGLLIEDGHNSDNLAIVLATYFSDYQNRPEDDSKDNETGWGKWVIEKTYRAIELIAEGTSIEKLEELSAVQSEYIKLLEAEVKRTEAFASVHNMFPDSDTVQRAAELRELISKIHARGKFSENG